MSPAIRLLTPDDLRDFSDLLHVFENVFEMENFTIPDDTHLINTLRGTHFLAVVAKVADQVVGGLTAYVLDSYYTTKPFAYIFDLAILPDFQRQGIGKQLIAWLNDYCTVNGFEEVFVQADRVDSHAVDFYRATQPSNEEDVIHFYYSLGRPSN